MATLDDLTDDLAVFLTSLGFDSTALWANRETPISGTARGFVRVVSSSEVPLGSNLVYRIAEVEMTCARKLGAAETYATLIDWMHVRLASATTISSWIARAPIRQSPVPEVEIERDLEKVGQVLVFSIRAQVALEG